MFFPNVPAIEGFRTDRAPAGRLACLIALAVALLCLAPPAAGATKTWIGGTGQWDTSGNWSPSGQPQASDDVFLTQKDATDRTVTYYNTTNPSALLGYLWIDATGTGTITLNMPNSHTLSVEYEFVGFYGKGAVTQSAGTNKVAWFYLGLNAGSNGSYTITGGSLSSSECQYIGHSGNGTLSIQNGGQVFNTYSYGCLGYTSGASGAVTVDGTGSKWTNSGELYVGGGYNPCTGATGSLHILKGGEISNTTAYLGHTFGSSGTATVDGIGSKWTNSGELYVGYQGTGTLNILNGGQVSSINGCTWGTATVDGIGSKWTNSGGLTVYGTLNILNGGQVSDINADLLSGGYVTVDGIGSKWTNSKELHVGESGTNTLNILNGGHVSNTDGYVGYKAGSSTVTVDGTGSQWTNTRDLYVGRGIFGTGTLNIQNGGAVYNASDACLGYYSSSSGAVTVDGTGSKWNSWGILTVGRSGTGTLNIQNGGQVYGQTGCLGIMSGSKGTATVDGSGSKWTNTYLLYVGHYGTGTLDIKNGGEVYKTSDGYLGYYSGSSGAITVDGVGSKLWDSGEVAYLYVGYHGIGTLGILNGGQVTSGGEWLGDSHLGYYSESNGTVTVDGMGSIWNNRGSLYIGGKETEAGGTGSVTVQNGGQLAVGGTLKVWNSGSLTIQSGGGVTAPVLSNHGTFNWNGGTAQVAAVELNGTSKSTLGAGHDKTLVTQALTIAESAPGVPTATLDLTDNRMVIDYDGDPPSSPLEQVKAWIKAGWLSADAPWYGPGITSTTARENPDLYTIAFVDQGRLLAETGELWYGPGGTRGETFGGIAVDETSILVRLTYLGDVDLDGKVYDDDVGIMSGNYSPTGPTGAEYWGGDIFGFDGWVYDDEAAIIGGAYNNGRLYGDPLGAADGQGAIPEPASALLVGVGGILFALRRRRR